MLKNVIEKELKEQKISRTLLLDGICGEQEFFLWVEEGEPAVCYNCCSLSDRAEQVVWESTL